MENPETSLFIKALPGGATEDILADHFSHYGVVLGTKVIRDRSGTRLGFGSVTFDDAYSVRLALRDLSSHRILGQKIHVKRWEQRPKRSQEPMMSQQPPSQSTRMYDGYSSSGTTFVGGVESNNRRDTGDHQPGGSTSRSDYIDSPAPTNNGVLPPGFGLSTSGIGGNGGWIQQGEYTGFPSGIPQISPSGIGGNGGRIQQGEYAGFPSHQPGGSTSRSDYIDSPAPTNNGVPPPGFGLSTSGIGGNGGWIQQGEYTGFPSGIPQISPSGIGGNGGWIQQGEYAGFPSHQPGGSTSRSDYIDSPAPTNNGILPPGFGLSTSGIGGNGGWIQQGEYTGFPSGIPQISPSGIGGNGGWIQQGEYAGFPSGIPRNVPPSGIDGTFEFTPNFPQPGGSSSRFDCPAPTNNGVPYPYSRRFTSEIGVNGDQILQGIYGGFPSSIPRNVPSQESMDSRYDVIRNFSQASMSPIGTRPNVPRMSLAPIGTRPNVPRVSLAPIGTRPDVPPVLMAPIGTRPNVSSGSTYPHAPANMSRDGGRGRATGSQIMHNRATAQAMDHRGFVSENALADLNSSRDEYETPDFDGTAGQRFN